MTNEPLQDILIGTAGHIDHGKTQLVRRLTGIDTDRLPEEKARGISIDLGFAHWQAEGFRFGIVDVPGHERFIKNMVAGASGVDMALLVVAADDGVMPQTREHLDIMQLLGLRAGLVAITKIDLVEPEYVELVEDEVRELTKGTFLEGCPVVRVSSHTGEGFDRLKAALLQVARQIERSRPLELFRMPIDRSLSIPGHGTVVTGSVVSGQVQAGDTLELLPAQRTVRVRSVQTYGVSTELSGPGRRTAINLAGVRQEEVERGMEVATPGFLVPSRRLVVHVQCLSSSPSPLKDRMELSLHIGTAEVLARLVTKGRALKPGESGHAELRTHRPVVAVHGQRFILRRPSPPLTVAGGRVLDPCAPPRRRIKDLTGYAEAFGHPDPQRRLAALLKEKDAVPDEPLEAARRVGVSPSQYGELVERLRRQGELLLVGDADRPLLVHRERLQALSAAVLRTVRDEVARHQPRRSLPKATLLTACRELAPLPLLEAVFEKLVAEKQLVRVGQNLGPADAQVRLTRQQSALLQEILERTAAGGLAPPTTKELAAQLNVKLQDVQALQQLAAEEGLLVRVGEGLYFTPESLERARQVCEQLFARQPELTVSQLREAWGVSRKFSVPVCEYFDKLQVTVRKGDVRVAGPNLHQPLV